MTLPFPLATRDLSKAEAALRARLYYLQKFGPIDLSENDRQQVDEVTRFETQRIDGERVVLIDRRKTRGSRSHEYSYDKSET